MPFRTRPGGLSARLLLLFCLALFAALSGALAVRAQVTEPPKTPLPGVLEEARALFLRGDYAAALAAYERAHQLALQQRDQAATVAALRGLGNVHFRQSDLPRAQDYYQRSLKLAEAWRDQSGILNAVLNLGNVHFGQGDYGKALEHYQRCKMLAEQHNDVTGLVNALNNIGSVYLLQASHALALEAQQRTLKLAQELGDTALTAQCLNNLGLTRLALHEHTQARADFEQALQLAEAKGLKPHALFTLNNLAVVHEAQGQYAAAESCYRKGLQLAEALGAKEALASLWSNLGNTRLLQGDQRQAIELTGRAMQLAQQIGNLEILSKSGTRAGKALAALGQPEQAQQAFATAIRAAEQLRCQAGGSAQERQRFLEARIGPYYGMIELLVAQGQHAEALDYAQRAKGRVLMDVLQSGKADLAKAMTATEAEQERRLARELAALNTALYRERLKPQPDEARLNALDGQLQHLRVEQEGLQAALYTAHPELKLQRGELRPLSLAEIGGLLPDAQTAILEFIVAEEQTYLFAITRAEPGAPAARGQRHRRRTEAEAEPSGAVPSDATPPAGMRAHPTQVNLQVYPLGLTRKEVNELTERFRRRIANRHFDIQELSSELYRRLLAPARAQLRNKQALIVIPDGGLWQLPFQALQSAPASGSSRGRYLIEDYSIAYAPSLPVLQAMLRQRAARPAPDAAAASTLLAFGNPALGAPAVARAEALLMGDRLAPLPETERQVNALKQVYGAGHSKVLLGAAAREDLLKAEAGHYRILHLATHGILDDASPLYSQLLLSQTPEVDGEDSPVQPTQEDGLLEAWEIMRMDLQADLVVLSACETARGRVGSGEGIIGLTWAFFIAGSPANVVSQWKVESRSTAELMLAFHRRLQPQQTPLRPAQTGLNTAEALRQAALTLLRQPAYRHPFYWAGFVLIGAGR